MANNKLKKSQIRILLYGLVFIVFIMFGSMAYIKSLSNDSKKQQADASTEVSEESEAKKTSFSATGDVILHDAVIKSHEQNDSYDFLPMFTEVKDYIKSDFNFTNLETAIGGEQFGYTGYPIFNSPNQIVDDLTTLGFNLFSTANNHTLDNGKVAAEYEREYFSKFESITMSGIKDSCDDLGIRYFEDANGVTYSFIAMTALTNQPLPDDCTLVMYDENTIDDILKKMNEKDVTILSLQYGQENITEVNAEEQKMFDNFLNNGVEVVLAHHPHVLRPIEKLKNSDGNDALVAYSLGNFAHSQLEDIERLGGILQFDISKVEEKIEINNVEFTPTYMDYKWSESQALDERYDLKVLPLSRVNELYGYDRQNQLVKLVKEIISDEFLPTFKTE